MSDARAPARNLLDDIERMRGEYKAPPRVCARPDCSFATLAKHTRLCNVHTEFSISPESYVSPAVHYLGAHHRHVYEISEAARHMEYARGYCQCGKMDPRGGR